MSSTNGVRAKALKQRPPYGPDEAEVLRAARTEILLTLVTTDDERRVITEELLGWEERPAVTVLVDELERRVEDRDDRWILERARGFRRLLPAANPEPPADPVLEGLILERVARKVQAAAVADVALDKVVAIHVLLRKAKTPAEIEMLQAKAAVAGDDRTQAMQALDHEMSRLADLLQQRANRVRWFRLAESTTS